jgi:hypothetical protein
MGGSMFVKIRRKITEPDFFVAAPGREWPERIIWRASSGDEDFGTGPLQG